MNTTKVRFTIHTTGSAEVSFVSGVNASFTGPVVEIQDDRGRFSRAFTLPRARGSRALASGEGLANRRLQKLTAVRRAFPARSSRPSQREGECWQGGRQ